MYESRELYWLIDGYFEQWDTKDVYTYLFIKKWAHMKILHSAQAVPFHLQVKKQSIHVLDLKYVIPE